MARSTTALVSLVLCAPACGGVRSAGSSPGATDARPPAADVARLDAISSTDTPVEGGSRSPADAAAADVLSAEVARAPLPDDLSYLQKAVPVLFITAGQGIPRGTKVAGTFKIVEDHDGSLTGIESRPATLAGKLGISVRGNTSSKYAQKPYGVEIRDDAGMDLAVPLLGLPKESDFVMHSCYQDKSCLRNALTYAIAREMGAPAGRWAPRTRYVEVYLEGQYQGLYLLVEKIKRDKHRVALPAPAPDAAAGDLTGGYVWSFEGGLNKPVTEYFLDAITGTRRWVYRAPNSIDITAGQKSYLQGVVGSLLRAVTVANPRWPDIKKVADGPSWVDYFITQEITFNSDGYWQSWYFYKQADRLGGLIYMAPPWDYDNAYGSNSWGKRYCANRLASASPPDPSPFDKLFKDPALLAEIKCRYLELRSDGGALDVARIDAKIDGFVKHIERAKARDGVRWKNIGKYSYPDNYIGATWADEVLYFKYWIHKRLAWLDGHLPGVCPGAPAPRGIAPMMPPPPIKETAPRPAQPPVFISLEAPPDPAYAMFACP